VTPTWAELHELEPGLRPIGLTAGHDGTWDQEWIGLDGSVDAGVSDRIGGPVGDALSRDRACEWLAEQRSYWYLQRYNDTKDWWWNEPGEDGACAVMLRGKYKGFPTRDEALRVACAAVIGARRAPAPSASSPGTAQPATP